MSAAEHQAVQIMQVCVSFYRGRYRRLAGLKILSRRHYRERDEIKLRLGQLNREITELIASNQ